jgi:hypothetical protein
MNEQNILESKIQNRANKCNENLKSMRRRRDHLLASNGVDYLTKQQHTFSKRNKSNNNKTKRANVRNERNLDDVHGSWRVTVIFRSWRINVGKSLIRYLPPNAIIYRRQ